MSWIKVLEQVPFERQIFVIIGSIFIFFLVDYVVILMHFKCIDAKSEPQISDAGGG